MRRVTIIVASLVVWSLLALGLATALAVLGRQMAYRRPARPAEWLAVLIALVVGGCAAGANPAAAVPAARTMAPADPAHCPAAEIIRVHGTGEGPSATVTQDTPEIKAARSRRPPRPVRCPRGSATAPSC